MNARPGRVMSSVSRSNSFFVSVTGAPSAVTVRAAGERRMPPNVRSAGAVSAARPLRRSSARTRATSSIMPKGFVR